MANKNKLTSRSDPRTTPKQNTPPRKKMRLLTAAVLLIAAAFGTIVISAYFSGKFSSVDSFRNYISKFGSLGPSVLTAFQAAQVVMPVLPGFMGCAVGTLMFGPIISFLCNYIGISTGSIVAFFLGRRLGTPLLRELFPAEKYRKWSARAAQSRSYIAFLFLAMLLPLFPDDYLCYLSGMTDMKAKKFIWIIILGKPWCILAYSFGFSFFV